MGRRELEGQVAQTTRSLAALKIKDHRGARFSGMGWAAQAEAWTSLSSDTLGHPKFFFRPQLPPVSHGDDAVCGTRGLQLLFSS